VLTPPPHTHTPGSCPLTCANAGHDGVCCGFKVLPRQDAAALPPPPHLSSAHRSCSVMLQRPRVHSWVLTPYPTPRSPPLTCANADHKGVLCGLKEFPGQDAAANEHLPLTHCELVGRQLQQLTLCACGANRIGTGKRGRITQRGTRAGAGRVEGSKLVIKCTWQNMGP
jgi:hypothetical protein